MNRTIALVAFSLALGGCEKKAENPAAGAAGGEVLPGSVSDAMLDTDQSQAQAPLVDVRPTTNAKLAGREAPVAEDSLPPTKDTSVTSATPPSKPVFAPGASPTPKPKPSAR